MEKEVSNEEHAEHVKQREAEKQRTQDEIQRRINEVGEAYNACTEFIEAASGSAL
jgi:cytochrome c556